VIGSNEERPLGQPPGASSPKRPIIEPVDSSPSANATPTYTGAVRRVTSSSPKNSGRGRQPWIPVSVSRSACFW
jgi:hypothetical protein